ncbi:hypothetical protein TrLO_g5677 [Triparma laevis f. longispina]|uniref:SAM domain-containing protein n=1 Tax=Triparma laevis f. longispina TaxID=1714387 RepID=A0A9W7F654_9STRA|nr:hypothetical protein TrLO_g5677 [Triparma laevis f. longispina]
MGPRQKESPLSLVAAKKRAGQSRRNNKECKNPNSATKTTLHDIGVDSGGTLRNIARTQQTAQSVLGTPTPVEWESVLKSLYNGKEANTSASVDLLDTVLCEHGIPVNYYYTDPRTGMISLKAKRFNKMSKIGSEFTRISDSSRSNISNHHQSSNPFIDSSSDPSHDYVAVLVSSDKQPTSLVTRELMDSFAKTSLPPDTTAVLPYIEPKAGTPTTSAVYTNFRHEYKLDELAKPRMRHLRLNVMEGVNGISSNPKSTVPSMNKPINDQMDRAVTLIVAALETKTNSRVSRVCTEFVLDSNESVWVVRTTACEVAKEPREAVGKRKNKTKQKEKRGEKYKDEAKRLRLDEEEMTAHEAGSYLPSSSDLTLKIDDRMLKRRQKKKDVDEDAVAKILSEDNFAFGSPVRYAKAGRRVGTPQGLQSPIFSPNDIALGGSSDEESVNRPTSSSSFRMPSRGGTAMAEALANKDPKNRSKTKLELNALAHSTSTSTLMGSTQMEMSCKGDFCGYDILTHTKSQSELSNSDFTKDSFIMTSDKPLTDLRSRLLEEERDATFDMLGQIKKERARSARGKKGEHSVSMDDELGAERSFFELPMSAVIQSRKEKHLVELLLRRHKKGEKNIDYVGIEDSDGFDLGESFPGHYYKPVKVCQCCFRVYNFIEAARNKSGKKIARAKVDSKKEYKAAQRERKRKIEGKDNLFPSNEFSSDEEDGNGNAPYNKNVSKMQEQFLDTDGTAMLKRAQIAIESISNRDVAEFKAFQNPPGAVKMVATTMMIILHNGKNLSWDKIKPLLTNGEKLLNDLLDFDPESLSDKTFKSLEPYLRNPNFKPSEVVRTSVVAAKFCAWVLGIANAYKCRKGFAHERVDVLAKDDFFNSPYFQATSASSASFNAASTNPDLLSPDSKNANRNNLVAPMPSMQIAMQEVMAGRGPSDDEQDDLSFAEKIARKKTEIEQSNRDWNDYERDKIKRKKRKQKLKAKQASQQRTQVGFGRGGVGAPKPKPAATSMHRQMLYGSDTDDSIEPMIGSAVHKKRAKIAAQRRRMEELAGEGGGTAKGATAERKTLLCSDGITRIPYEVIGKSEMEITKVNFVVCHDIFDSCDMTKMLFLSVVKRHPGCQILLFNYPGQAGTTFPNSRTNGKSDQVVPAGAEHAEPALNNDFLSDRVHELIGHVDATGEFISSAQPFHIIGMGNGLPIALAFAEKYGHTPYYASTLRSLVSLNGFTSVDPQLASILHSSLNVFKAFPSNRPDLPVSYFTRFLFSDEYLSHVPRNLALNLYTAVTNPITLEGRVRLCAGALKHRDMQGVLKNLKVPLIAMQSTENVFVNASNVDSLLEGRNASHVWSHQLNLNLPEDQNCYSTQSLESLLGALNRKRGAMVVFVRAGHALQQESKRSVVDLLDVLACPTPAYTGIEVPEIMEASFKPSAKIKNAGSKNIDEDVGEEKKEVAKEEELEGYVPGEFLDDPRDAADMEEEAMRLAEQKAPVIKPVVDNHFEKLQVELMAQIESEHKQMVKDADLKPSAEEGFEEGTGYTVQGAPTGEFDSAIEEGERYESKLEAESERMRKELVDRREREIQQKEAEEQARRDKLEAGRQKLLEEERRAEKATKEALAAAESFASAKPFIPPPVGIPPPREVGVEPMFSPIKPTKAAVREEPSTRFYMQDIRGGEQEMQTSFDEPLASATETGMGIYGGFASQGPAGDVKKPVQVKAVIPGLDLKGEKGDEGEGGVDDHFQQMFKETLEKKVLRDEVSGGMDDVEDMLKMGVPVEALPNELLVPPPNDDQKAWRTWSQEPGANPAPLPGADETLQQDAQLRQAHEQERREQERRLRREEEESQKMIAEIQKKQEERRKEYEKQDMKRLQKLEREALERKAQRAQEELQRRLEIQEQEEKLIRDGLAEPFVVPEGMPEPVKIMPPTFYEEAKPLPSMFTEEKDLDKIMDGLNQDEAAARKMGITRIEEFDKIKSKMAQAQLERDTQLRTMKKDEQESLFNEMAVRIQNVARGMAGKNKSRVVRARLRENAVKGGAVIKIQKAIRGYLSRRRVLVMRQQEVMQLILGSSAISIQRVWRGYLGRCEYLSKIRLVSACFLQRIFRGMLGRKAAKMERARLDQMRKRADASIKIQSTWKMKVAREEYRVLRIHLLASVEIQRIFRGLIGRRRAMRVRKWESTEPGADRLKLGLELINESKIAFERQSEEIDALHRAQEKAEARVSHIHVELKESEKELGILEKELQDIDQIEKDLQELTHERKLLAMGIVGAVGIDKTGQLEKEEENMAGGESHDIFNANAAEKGDGRKTVKTGSMALDRERMRSKQSEAHALEMAIHMKRAEREKKKQELESEFTLVFSEVERKKASLERLEVAIADMEATRQRKDREFGRLQRNLMELLQEQKFELDSLREKGIELETATATSAAAAAATAQKAKEHEKQSSVMYNQQEELMKFQFMSMSLSYFSSLNMLKQMREINTDTTSAAISSSANVAAAAAAAAAAANIPAIKQLKLGAEDQIDTAIAQKEAALHHKKNQEEDAKKAKEEPFPKEVRLWSVEEVSRWLQTLSLGQYVVAFREACVDGEFLLELREEDMSSVLEVKHKLHRRKILLAREKLKPLNRQEILKKEVVDKEEGADSKRMADLGADTPDLNTVFSQCRHGRLKRVEESLRSGFDVMTEDDKGNTLLLVATQNGHRKMLDLLLNRAADINHQNSNGNTALHYALAFDTSGEIAEYLIEKGADDSIENQFGLSAYDGLGESGM